MSEHANNVYGRIAAVSAEIATTGISKDRSNQQQGYRFRGIDDVYNALAPILAKHHLVIIPRILSRECVERQNKSGGALFNVTVEAEFDFVSALDGSKHTARTYGEAMDSGDKATNKAMSAAYKYAAFQAFCIPTEGENDADATTPDVAAGTKPSQPRQADRQQAQAERPVVLPHGVERVTVSGAKIAKKGTSGKGPWTLHIVAFSDGREGKTFSTSVYQAAQDAMRSGQVVDVDITDKGEIVNLLPVRQLEEAPF